MAGDRVVLVNSGPDQGPLERLLRSRGYCVMKGDFGTQSVLALAVDADAAAVVFNGFPSDVALRDINDAVELRPTLGIIVIGPLRPQVDVLVALSSGVSGYLGESADAAEIADAVHTVVCGQPYVPAPVSGALVQQLRFGGGVVVERRDGGTVRLTPREWEILVLLRQCRTTAEIAHRLVIAHVTVRSHVHGVLRKLGLANRQELTGTGRELKPIIDRPVDVATASA
jgi:DNA-binding NarL/FixJ family response regulator